jgi:hypothetical protein
MNTFYAQQSFRRSEPLHQPTMMNHSAFFDPRLVAGAARVRRRGSTEEAQEVAGFLLQLKHRSVTPEPMLSHDDPDRRLLVQQAQAAQLRNLAYPSMGAVYGLATVGFDQTLIERPPALLEEPVMPDMSWELLLGESKLVFMKDRDLVPDSLFVAMAQMKACKLTQADRVGCYKNRDVDFTGMCCKHCGGQPGFGRYYPNSVRSLAQTTTSQTILKHIGSKCRFCPPQVRQAVLELQRQQAAKEGIAAGRPRYGSRKIFFQRMWARLHGSRAHDADVEDDDEDSNIGENASQASASDAEQQTPVHSDIDTEDEDDDSIDLRHNNIRRLPTQKNAKRKQAPEERERKRLRVVGL